MYVIVDPFGLFQIFQLLFEPPVPIPPINTFTSFFNGYGILPRSVGVDG
jgi:hypothetical protein